MKTKAQEYGLEVKQAENLKEGLSIFLDERNLLIDEFEKTSKLEITEETIPQFKELRLSIMRNRTQGIDKWHKQKKEIFLRGGQFVDAIKKAERQVNLDMEEVLLNGENHFENLEKERLTKLQAERVKLLSPFVEDVEHLNLGGMPEDVWKPYFESKKNQHLERLEAEKKAEAERIEEERLNKVASHRRQEIAPYAQFNKENKDLREMSEGNYLKLLNDLKESKKEYEAQQEAQRKENERLKIEAEEREAEAETKRLAYLKELEKERKAKAKLESEIKAKKKAEAKAEADRLAKIKADKKEAERLAKAPVKDKLNLWVDSFGLPDTDVNNKATKEINAKFQAFKNWSKKQINEL